MWYHTPSLSRKLGFNFVIQCPKYLETAKCSSFQILVTKIGTNF